MGIFDFFSTIFWFCVTSFLMGQGFYALIRKKPIFRTRSQKTRDTWIIFAITTCITTLAFVWYKVWYLNGVISREDLELSNPLWWTILIILVIAPVIPIPFNRYTIEFINPEEFDQALYQTLKNLNLEYKVVSKGYEIEQPSFHLKVNSKKSYTSFDTKDVENKHIVEKIFKGLKEHYQTNRLKRYNKSGLLVIVLAVIALILNLFNLTFLLKL